MHDHKHEHHTHCHEHVSEAVHKKDVKKLFTIAAINAGLMVFSFGFSKTTGVSAFTAEAAHDLNDTIISGSRGLSAKHKLEQKSWYGAFRKVSYAAIIGFGGFAAAKSGLDFYHATPKLKHWQDATKELIGAGIVATGNQAAYVTSTQLETPSLTNADALHHARNDRNVSLMLAGGIAVGAIVPYATELAGVLAGSYTVVHMGKHAQQ